MNQGNKRLQKVMITLTTMINNNVCEPKKKLFLTFFSYYVALLFAFSTSLY